MSSTVNTQEMVLVHRALRRELSALPTLVRGATDAPRRRRVAQHVREMLHFLHTHHQGEDELLWPLLRLRAPLDADLVERMESQHRSVAAALGTVEAALDSWESAGDTATAERIASTVEGMLDVLFDHLANEEQHILPLVAQHVTPAEWAELGKHGMAQIPPPRRMVLLGHVLEEADAAERREMLSSMPLPVRALYLLVGRRKFAKEVAVVRGAAVSRVG